MVGEAEWLGLVTGFTCVVLLARRRGGITRKDLVQVIDGKILPALQSARLELQHVDRAPRDLLPHVRAAEIYTLRRIESWRIRADALRTGNSRRLRDAEAVERTALERLRSIPPGIQQLIAPAARTAARPRRRRDRRA